MTNSKHKLTHQIIHKNQIKESARATGHPTTEALREVRTENPTTTLENGLAVSYKLK